MKILVIFAHPSSGSFNHAVAGEVVAILLASGHQVAFPDLCPERFDPMIPDDESARYASLSPLVAEHCREIAGAEGIVIIHPDWWGIHTAILNGWIDRVLRPGVAYRFFETDSGEGIPLGLLAAQTAPCFQHVKQTCCLGAGGLW